MTLTVVEPDDLAQLAQALADLRQEVAELRQAVAARPSGLPITCNIAQAEKLFGISANTLYGWARTGEKPGFLHLGKRVLVRPDVLLGALE